MAQTSSPRSRRVFPEQQLSPEEKARRKARDKRFTSAVVRFSSESNQS